MAELTDAERKTVIEKARSKKGTPHSVMDCSHLVNYAYKAVRPELHYLTTDGLKASKLYNHDIKIPEPGDLVLWAGHVGIVINPDTKTFIGSQSSTGVAESSYAAKSYWGKQSHSFLRLR
jgi:cell wall-associated NlpC family hydrolase